MSYYVDVDRYNLEFKKDMDAEQLRNEIIEMMNEYDDEYLNCHKSATVEDMLLHMCFPFFITLKDERYHIGCMIDHYFKYCEDEWIEYARLFEDGSYIAFIGEDGSIWKIEYSDNTAITLYGRVCYEGEEIFIVMKNGEPVAAYFNEYVANNAKTGSQDVKAVKINDSSFFL